jgi:hypothetical protein
VTWLTWRQHRFEVVVAAGLLAAASCFLLVTGLHIGDVYSRSHVAGCLVGARADTPACGQVTDAFTSRFDALVGLTSWFNLLPLAIGALVAAPLAVEFEQGTHRLAWTQTVTRRRWYTARVLFVMGAAVAGALILTLLMTWWRGPFDHIGGRLGAEAFDFEGAVTVAYTVFAAAVALAAATLIRRALPAIGLTIAAFLGLRLATEGWLRFHYLPAIHATGLVGHPPPANQSGAWISDSGASLPVGFHGTAQGLAHACGIANPDPGDLGDMIGLGHDRCLALHGLHEFAVYQPASRFWALQGVETTIFLGLAAGLVALSVWAVQRRIA